MISYKVINKCLECGGTSGFQSLLWIHTSPLLVELHWQPTFNSSPFCWPTEYQLDLLLLMEQSCWSPTAPLSAAILTWASPGKTICSGTAIEALLIPCSLMVEWPPELCHSRNHTLYLQKALEEAALLRTSSILTELLSPSLFLIFLLSPPPKLCSGNW